MISGYRYESFNDLSIVVAPFSSLIFFYQLKVQINNNFKTYSISLEVMFLLIDSIQRKMVRRKIWEKDLS